MVLFEPQRRKAATLLLAWLSASLNMNRNMTGPANILKGETHRGAPADADAFMATSSAAHVT